MAPNEYVEIRLVCKANYLDPQLKTKLHEIRDSLRQILHTGRRRFALKKVQPWNSIKVTFNIPKEAADRLHLLAVQGNIRLIELGILSVEIVGQSNTVVANNNNNKSSTAITAATTNNKELTASSMLNSTLTQNSALDTKFDVHQHNNNVMQTSSTNVNHINTTNHYVSQQVIHRHEPVLNPTYPTNNNTTSNSYHHDHSTPVNGTNLHDSWSDYKMKINGAHYYPSQHQQ
ncbi:unnamed protein product [Adineta steineri]|uniref:Nuclear receptor coactivator 6 TRADD-N domain-containing protein n=1 Tax=Adineta steineri TaxID=433720 RepID=A0A816DSH1_9BILA|nr:unnamed protein product [Adineta steineri]CAF1640435.1 unnamed protein product [Adineta steineri]